VCSSALGSIDWPFLTLLPVIQANPTCWFPCEPQPPISGTLPKDASVMTKATPTLAETLFEAHVKHEMAALKGAKLKKFLENEVDELLNRAGDLTLEKFISVDQVMGVIRRIAVNMELDAGIPELAAEMATEVMNAPVQSETTLGEILSRDQASAFIEEALELRQQRERIISEIMAHPVYQELVSNVVYHGLVNYLYEDNLLTRSVPGVGSMMKFGKKMANKAVP